jgi:hypothetical protein
MKTEPIPVIKLAILVSYDYQYIYESLPFLYAHADEITIAIDKDRRTWSGSEFTVAETLFEWISNIDTEGKIKIYEDHFYDPALSTMQNDTRERTMIGAFMGAGGWHVQIDADEYFPEFGKFTEYLKKQGHLLTNAATDPVDIYLFWITLYKQTANGFIFIKNSAESFPAATNHPVYTAARQTGSRPVYANFSVFHQSWARSPEEIETKINNWSHSADFNVSDYFSFWKQMDENNFHSFKNIHPVNATAWKKTGFLKAASLDAFIMNYGKKFPIRLSWWKFRHFKKQERLIRKKMLKNK